MNVLNAPPGLQSAEVCGFLGLILRSGVRWQSGDASDCKSADAGSIPARTSNKVKVSVELNLLIHGKRTFLIHLFTN
jgi:hypothetical protein